MMFVLEVLFALFIVVPILISLLSGMTATGGLIETATNSTAVNGTATNAGNFLLVFWQAFPYLIGLFLLIALFRFISGKLQKKDELPPSGGLQ